MSDTHASSVLSRLQSEAQDMSVWLKVLGAVTIAIGIPSLLGLVGALYIWLGVLLWQAGTAAQSSQPEKLKRMMTKLKTVFIVSAILSVLALGSLVIGFISIGSALFTLLQNV